MQHKFAKALAANIRVIAACTAKIAVIDISEPNSLTCEARCACTAEIEKAENAIVSILQQPGARLND